MKYRVPETEDRFSFGSSSVTVSGSSQNQSQRPSQYISSVWGNLRQFAIPSSIFADDRLILKPAPLAVLLVLCQAVKAQTHRRKMKNIRDAECQIDQASLIMLSGYSENVIAKAVTDLQQKNFIKPVPVRRKDGKYSSNVYALCEPKNGLALSGGSSNPYYAHRISYIRLPICLVTDYEQRWSLAKIKGSPLRLYVGICKLANSRDEGGGSITVTIPRLKKLSGLSTINLAEESLALLEDKALLSVDGDEITLNDPYLGEPVRIEEGDPTTDPANYYDAEGTNRFNLNDGDADAVYLLLKQIGFNPEVQHDGQLHVVCPFHLDQSLVFCEPDATWLSLFRLLCKGQFD